MTDPSLPLAEMLGYLASLLVFLTFCMRTMMPLRLVAIASNLASVAYGALAGLMPILLLHAVLLPLNAVRLWQMRDLVRRVRRARSDRPAPEMILPHAETLSCPAGATVFARGDAADAMYLVVSGEVEVADVGVRLGPGEIFGEVGLFAAGHARTATVRTTRPSRLARLTEERVHHLYYQDPEFAFFLLRLVTDRLVENWDRSRTATAPAEVDGPAPAPRARTLRIVRAR